MLFSPQIVALSLRKKPRVETLIGAGVGTIIADNTGATVTGIFDGNTNQAAVAGRTGATTVARAGKDYGGSPKVISGYKDYASNDGGYANLAAGATITHTLKASNTDPTTTSWTGTTIGSVQVGNNNTSTTSQSLGDTTQGTAYRYVWVEITHTSASQSMWFAEIEFYEWL
jgi:hypothetical protein